MPNLKFPTLPELTRILTSWDLRSLAKDVAEVEKRVSVLLEEVSTHESSLFAILQPDILTRIVHFRNVLHNHTYDIEELIGDVNAEYERLGYELEEDVIKEFNLMKELFVMKERCIAWLQSLEAITRGGKSSETRDETAQENPELLLCGDLQVSDEDYPPTRGATVPVCSDSELLLCGAPEDIAMGMDMKELEAIVEESESAPAGPECSPLQSPISSVSSAAVSPVDQCFSLDKTESERAFVEGETVESARSSQNIDTESGHSPTDEVQVQEPPSKQPDLKISLVVGEAEKLQTEEPKVTEPKYDESEPEVPVSNIERLDAQVSTPEPSEPGDTRTEDPKPEDPKPKDPKQEDPKPEDPKPENPKPEDPKQAETAADAKQTEPISDETKPEDQKPDDKESEQAKTEGQTPDEQTGENSDEKNTHESQHEKLPQERPEVQSEQSESMVTQPRFIKFVQADGSEIEVKNGSLLASNTDEKISLPEYGPNSQLIGHASTQLPVIEESPDSAKAEYSPSVYGSVPQTFSIPPTPSPS